MKATKFKKTLLVSLFAASIPTGSVMAADNFRALNNLQATPTPLHNDVLAHTEGGAVCQAGDAFAAVNGGLSGGGVALCSELGGKTGVIIAVANELPVTGANFLGVIGGRAP
jgi:hypothetical protein